MALVNLQDVDWTLTDKRQDIRGRELRDAVGRSLGQIEHMIVDTEQERVVSVRLKDTTEYPADDLQIMEDAIYYIPPDPAVVPAGLDETPPTSETASVAVPPPVPVPVEEEVDAADPAIPAPPEAASTAPHEDRTPLGAPATVVPPGRAAIPAPPDPGPAPAAEPQAPGAYLDADFRNHYEAEYEDSRLSYADLQFAYRFGFDAARTPPLSDRGLETIDEDLRRVFYARFNYPASDVLVWTVVVDAVRYGFRLGRR